MASRWALATRQRAGDIGEQCSTDMMQAEVEEDVEAKLMLRQRARVRLYY
jgi:hypothetical protein